MGGYRCRCESQLIMHCLELIAHGTMAYAVMKVQKHICCIDVALPAQTKEDKTTNLTTKI